MEIWEQELCRFSENTSEKNGTGKRRSVRMSTLLNKIRSRVLVKWIIMNVCTFMIPIVCAIGNYFVCNNLIMRKTEQVNRFVLMQMADSIDAHCRDIYNLSKNFLVDEDFSCYKFNTSNHTLFVQRIRQCYRQLNIASKANSDIEVMLYLPQSEYIVNSYTANTVQNLYRSMYSSGKIDITLDEWLLQLIENRENNFYIIDDLSYSHYGTNCLTYISQALDSTSQYTGWLYISTPVDFIGEMLQKSGHDMENFLILDEKDNVLASFGQNPLPDSCQDFSGGVINFSVDSESYIGACTISSTTGWRYVLYAPESVYKHEVNQNMLINFSVILSGMVCGILVLCLLQKKNYQPLKKLIKIIPQQSDDCSGDEYEKIERSLKVLFNEKQLYQKHSAINKSVGLLMAIQGRNLYLYDYSLEEMLGKGYEDKCFSVVTFQFGMEDEYEELYQKFDRNILNFILNNVVDEVIGKNYHFIQTNDNNVFVCLLILDHTEREKYLKEGKEKFTWICDFFADRMGKPFYITMGDIFDNFEDIDSCYLEIKDINNQRYYVKASGVIWASEMQYVRTPTVERISYYSRRFISILERGDTQQIQCQQEVLFAELKNMDCPFEMTSYYILSLANYILLERKNTFLPDKVLWESLCQSLDTLRDAASEDAIKEAFREFLRLYSEKTDYSERQNSELGVRIKEYVEANYCNCDINISVIADHFGITPRYMSRLFREQTGENLLNFINDKRIGHARLLLQTTSKTVEEIAVMTGFANTRTFYRNFQKVMGMSPASYRQAVIQHGSNPF